MFIYVFLILIFNSYFIFVIRCVVLDFFVECCFVLCVKKEGILMWILMLFSRVFVFLNFLLIMNMLFFCI